MSSARIPLFRFDPGWLFVLSGLAVCIACALTSARHELQTLRVQQSLLDAEEQYAYARLRAHEEFLTQLDEPDEALTRRLAAAELNLMPADEEPVLRLVTLDLPTVDWIDRMVERPAPQPVLAVDTMLTRLATGPQRLWVFGAGVLCVFMGLLLDPGSTMARRRRLTRPVARMSDDAAISPALVEVESTLGAAECELPALFDGAVTDEMNAHAANIAGGEVDGANELEVDALLRDVKRADEEDADSDMVGDDSGALHETEVEEFDAGGDEYELIADDLELVELAEGDKAAHDESAFDDPPAAGDELRESKSVISIRPSMSVAPPGPDVVKHDSHAHGEKRVKATNAAVDDDDWSWRPAQESDEGAVDSQAPDDENVERRIGKATREEKADRRRRRR